MPVTITFAGDTWGDIAGQMAEALKLSTVIGVTTRVVDTPKDDPEPNKVEAPKTTARKAKDTPPKDEPKDEAKDGPQEPADGALDYDRDIKPSVLEIARRYGRDKVMELLSKYNVVNAAHVPAEDQAALIEDIAAILAE